MIPDRPDDADALSVEWILLAFRNALDGEPRMSGPWIFSPTSELADEIRLSFHRRDLRIELEVEGSEYDSSSKIRPVRTRRHLRLLCWMLGIPLNEPSP